MDDVTSALVGYVHDFDPSQLTDEDRGAVSLRLLDTFACAYDGLDAAPVRSLATLAAQRPVPGGCSVWGSAVRSTPEQATLVNSTAVRILDYNDYTVGGHPSDMVPSVVAACEWADASVADLVAGVVVGYEVFGELGRTLIRYRGWDQSTTAALATACAASRVLGLGTDQAANAIGIAATACIVTGKARRGQLTEWKGVAGPYAAQGGLLGAMMAQAGVSSPHDAFDGEFGFFAQVSGEFAIERLDPGARPYYLHRTAGKQWPVQFDLQPAIQLGARVRAEVDLDRIASIQVETSEWTWKGTSADPAVWSPTNRETADHSLPYILAVALERGDLCHDDFSTDAVAAGSHLRWLPRIQVAPAEDITAAAKDTCTMRATVVDVDGATERVTVSTPRSAPMNRDATYAKWQKLTSGSRLSGRAGELFTSLAALDQDQPVRDLIAPLRLVDSD